MPAGSSRNGPVSSALEPVNEVYPIDRPGVSFLPVDHGEPEWSVRGLYTSDASFHGSTLNIEF
jgi:hypothetical protein